MTARIIDGKIIASELRARVAEEVARVQRAHGLTPGPRGGAGRQRSRQPGLCPQQAQADRRPPAWRRSSTCCRPTSRRIELLALIGKLNRDPSVHGILVQLPLPKSLDTEDHHQRHRPGQGCRRAASEQRRTARRRIGGAVALHAARLHHSDQERARLARGHERHRDRPLQSGRPAAGAIAAQRKRHGDDRAFALADLAAAVRAAPTWSMPPSAGRRWCAATGSSRAPP